MCWDFIIFQNDSPYVFFLNNSSFPYRQLQSSKHARHHIFYHQTWWLNHFSVLRRFYHWKQYGDLENICLCNMHWRFMTFKSLNNIYFKKSRIYNVYTCGCAETKASARLLYHREKFRAVGIFFHISSEIIMLLPFIKNCLFLMRSYNICFCWVKVNYLGIIPNINFSGALSLIERKVYSTVWSH